MKKLLECDFSNVPLEILKDDFMLRSKYGAEFYTCVQRNSSSKHIDSCLSVLTLQCQSSTLRGIKTIRLTFEMVEEIMTFLPDLKIIYLVRDPRATVQSRMGINFVQQSDIEKESSELCRRMSRDISHIKLSKNRQNIKIVQYENLAKSTISQTKEIFDFLGYKLHQNVFSWIKLNSVKSVDRNPFSTSRNSIDATYRWLKKMSPETAEKVEKSCDHLIKMFKYKTFEELQKK